MSSSDPFTDSTAFVAGQQHMQRRIGELLRQRHRLIANLPMSNLSRVDSVLTAELSVIIRAVDQLPTDGPVIHAAP